MLLMLGASVPSGAYLLRVDVWQPITLALGRHAGGQPIAFPEGTYAYVGSAMGRRGPSSLGRRLLRHATRTPGQPPHPIRTKMMCLFRQTSLLGGSDHPPGQKRLHWHIDYLLDRSEVDLSGAIVLRSGARWEAKLARMLADDDETRPVSLGLGATDSPGETHILRVPATVDWWAAVAAKINQLQQQEATDGSQGAQA